MDVTTKKPKLSINKKPGMWHEPSKIELIEKQLKEAAILVLDEFIGHSRSQSGYDAEFKINHKTTQSLDLMVIDAYKQLESVMRFPNQIKPAFERMAERVLEALILERGEVAHKFNEAYETFMRPKEHLPKVSLRTFV